MGGLPLSKSSIISPKDALPLMSGLDVLLSLDLSMDNLGMDFLGLQTCTDCLVLAILVIFFSIQGNSEVCVCQE